MKPRPPAFWPNHSFCGSEALRYLQITPRCSEGAGSAAFCSRPFSLHELQEGRRCRKAPHSCCVAHCQHQPPSKELGPLMLDFHLHNAGRNWGFFTWLLQPMAKGKARTNRPEPTTGWVPAADLWWALRGTQESRNTKRLNIMLLLLFYSAPPPFSKHDKHLC